MQQCSTDATNHTRLRRLQSPNNVILSRHRRIFRLRSGNQARRQTRNLRALVGIAEERDRLAGWCQAFGGADALRGWRRDDAVQS